MTIQALQSRCLDDSTTLSKWYLKNMIEPSEVIRVLNANEISFVLVGLHGLSAWMREPRGTKYVDVIVAAKQVKKAVRALLTAFPKLEAVDLEVVTRLKEKETDEVLIDVMKPNQQPSRSVFKNCIAVKDKGQAYRIPTLEMALVLKFAPMISLTRADEDKYQDAHDLIRMVKNNKDIELRNHREASRIDLRRRRQGNPRVGPQSPRRREVGNMRPEVMTTVLRVGPYRFFFYAGDRDEPPHVHVERDDSEAKYWLSPPRLERNAGFGRKELNKIEQIIEDHQEDLMGSWDEFFDQ